MLRQTLLAALTLGLALNATAQTAPAAPNMDPELRAQARRAIDGGLHYLRKQQGPDGSIMKSVGVTALALRAFLESPRRYNETDGPFITRPIEFILANARPDGSICERLQETGYNTAVAITALAATKNPKYRTVIENGRKFLLDHQTDEGEGYKPDHRFYGGIGYGGGERPDLANTVIALEGLKAAATDPKDPVWQKALTFVSRSQNRSESNDQSWAANDGGFIYMPGANLPMYGTGTSSYGSMTAAGLLSLLYAGTDKNDPRVKAAYQWLSKNFSLDVNPGTTTQHTLFYFYNAYAKVMAAYGEDTFMDGNGQRRNWRNELTAKLVAQQRPDGSWINTGSRAFWEDKPELVTAWAVLALEQVMK